MRPKIRTVQFALAVFTALLAACGGAGTDAGAGTVGGSSTNTPAGSGTSTSSDSVSSAATNTNLAAIIPINKIMPDLEFNKPAWVSDTQGSLPGMVFFAQSQVIPATVRINDDYQPRLMGLRDTLVLFKAAAGSLIDGQAVLLNAYSADGSKLNGSPVTMAHPNDIPKTPKFLTNLDLNSLSFDTNPTNPTLISTQSDLSKLNDPQATFLISKLATTNSLKIRLVDGAWTDTIYLPSGNFSGKNIFITSTARKSTVKYVLPNGMPNHEVIESNDTAVFTYVAGSGWVSQSDQNHSRYVYGKNFWSTKLPKEWIKPGLKLEFFQDAKSSTLNFASNGKPGLAMGAPTDLLLHVIDVGMLTAPQNKFEFAKDATAHAEYFQTIPASRLVVNQYESMQLDDIHMPDGRVFTPSSPDPSTGGWQSGDMRRYIAKLLISHGIDNANYGISSSSSKNESGHPYLAAQSTAHTSIGKYQNTGTSTGKGLNGLWVHGGSGGAGMVTLEHTIGNEFSHEVGHNYGLDHGSGSRGVLGAIHRPASDVNSTWAWDSRSNQFIPNFVSKPTFQTYNFLETFEKTCDYTGINVTDGCVEPFQVMTSNGKTTAFSFGRDAMSDGTPNGAPYWDQINRFTIYTPHSASQIQTFLESKVTFDKTSSTGFRKWNSATYTTDEVTILAPYLTASSADTKNQLDVATYKADDFASYLQGIFNGGADLVSVQMSNGQWASSATAPAASTNANKYLTILHNANAATIWTIDRNTVKFSKNDQRSYLSDGKTWNLQPAVVDGMAVRKPESFGIPVTTVLGYYDPQNASPTPAQPGWPGYVYPALHGAYGFVYPSESASSSNKGCWLEVVLRKSTRRYRLLSMRIDDGFMNKIQVNVPESEGATKALVICNGTTLATSTLLAAKENLTYTVNGMPLPH